VKVPANQVFCYWEDPDYRGAPGVKVGPYSGRFNLTIGWGDQVSSVGFTPGVSINNCFDM
jgi:hypothetical protein